MRNIALSLALLASTCLAATPEEIIRDLASSKPGVRNLAASNALGLGPHEGVRKALLAAVPSLATTPEDALAQEAVLDALKRHYAKHPDVAEKFTQFFLEYTEKSLSRQEWEDPSADLLFAYFTRMDLNDRDALLEVAKNSRSLQNALAALVYLQEPLRRSTDIPILNALIAKLPKDGGLSEELTHTPWDLAFDAAINYRLKFGKAVRFPVLEAHCRDILLDPYKAEKLPSHVMEAIIFNYDTLAGGDPQALQTFLQSWELFRKIPTPHAKAVTAKLKSTIGAITGDIPEKPRPTLTSEQRMRNAIRAIQRIARGDRSRAAESLPSDSLIKHLTALPPEKQFRYLKALINNLLDTHKEHHRQQAFDVIEHLWNEENVQWRPKIQSSTACNAVLGRLKRQGRVHVNE